MIVSQPLAFGAFDSFDNAFAIIEFACIPAKSEFVTISMKMFLAHGMKRSQQATLYQREERFGTVHSGGGAVRIALGKNFLEDKWKTPDVIGVFRAHDQWRYKGNQITSFVSAEIKLAISARAVIEAFGQA